MDALLNVLPNLSVPVVSIIGLVYIAKYFVDTLDKRSKAHEQAMLEREQALRGVEADIRKNLVDVVARSTAALDQNSRVLGRVVDLLDKR